MVDQLKDSELLIKYGFIKKNAKDNYEFDKKKGYFIPKLGKDGKSGSYNISDVDEELDEESNLTSASGLSPYMRTGYPSPSKRYRLVFESFNASIEELYFWSLGHIRQDHAFPFTVKITDVFSASENSAFFGQSAQRISIQEDRASNFLKGISELVKTLFQIIRELRIIDERLEVYTNWQKSKSADSTLKGLFADFAENKGGQMQPGSIFHLAGQVGYSTLPDLFFNTHVYDKDKVDSVVDTLDYNKNVKSVLKRKLYQYLVWKEKTEQELVTRRRFQIKYLRQHYLVIKTYMSWVKPYLKHIKRLTMNEDKLDSADLITSFETSATEIEVLAYKKQPGNDFRPCVLMTFEFRTRPTLQYSQENNRGPVHVGRGIMTLRSYAWTDEQIRMYKKMRDDEDIELLGLVDDQLKAAMDMLRDDFDAYIREAEGTIEDDVPKHGKDKLVPIASSGNVYDPFVAIFKGFGEIGKTFVPNIKFGSPKKSGIKGDPGSALKAANGAMWQVYNNYKKAHGLLSW